MTFRRARWDRGSDSKNFHFAFQMMFKWWHPINFFYRNDIESVVVRAGCSFTGFDDSSLNGGSFTIRAGNSDRKVNLGDEDEYEDYDEKIQSLSCHCRG